jgi:integrase
MSKRTMHRLSATHLRKLPDGFHSDGRSLYLAVKGEGRSWVLRYQRHGKVTDMGLGSLGDLTLAEACTKATEARTRLALGQDPLTLRRQAIASSATAQTFRQCAEAYITAHEASWRYARHKAHWVSSLERHVYPTIGELPVGSVDIGLVLKVLEPIWYKTPSAASLVRGRIEAILGWATIRRYRTGDNPARWANHLEHALPEAGKLRRVRHHPSLPYAELAAFMAELRRKRGMTPRAMEFLILTAARSGEVRGARWDEIDEAERLWTIPEERMKASRPHRVPLSDQAMALLVEMRKLHHAGDGGFIFQGGRPGRPLSLMSLRALLGDMGRRDITTHGFRSTFRDWASERTVSSHEAIELSLAHVQPNPVVAAYARSDLLEKRRLLMAAWGAYCSTPAATADVVPLRRA